MQVPQLYVSRQTMSSQIFPEGDEHPYNTGPENYVIRITGKILLSKQRAQTPSHSVVEALRQERPDIQTNGFRRNVLDAIWDDAVEDGLGGGPQQERYLRRLNRWAKSNAREHLMKRCEILDTWRNRDSRFVPDAYLIDAANKTVVCYEVEDQHPLNPNSIGKYAAAWWCLEYIYWDLHLIAYDIYGNWRIIQLPESEFLARHVRGTKRGAVDAQDDDI